MCFPPTQVLAASKQPQSDPSRWFATGFFSPAQVAPAICPPCCLRPAPRRAAGGLPQDEDGHGPKDAAKPCKRHAGPLTTHVPWPDDGHSLPSSSTPASGSPATRWPADAGAAMNTPKCVAPTAGGTKRCGDGDSRETTARAVVNLNRAGRTTRTAHRSIEPQQLGGIAIRAQVCPTNGT